jgi:lysophospholipid acyltransferase
MERNYANLRISLKQFLANFRDLVLYQIFFLAFNPYFPSQAMSGPLWEMYSFSWKCNWILVAGWVLRARWYITFSYCQVAADLSGISYDSEQDNNELYRNVEFWGIEWDQRPKKRWLKWNQSVQPWLNHVCYIRCKPIFGTSNAALAVFILSAFWHGFYPAWYLIFSSAYCLQQIQITGYKCREA